MNTAGVSGLPFTKAELFGRVDAAAQADVSVWLDSFYDDLSDVSEDVVASEVMGTHSRDFILLPESAYAASGGRGADWIEGGSDDDVIFGGRGKDVLIGGEGYNYLDGGKGQDILIGGNETDELWGGRGADKLFGGDGDDFLMGERGSDRLYAGDGDDELWGGRGRDFLSGGDGDDALLGEAGHDTLEGGDGADYLDGGRGRDSLDGGAGDDLLVGGRGADTLYDRFGNDEMDGGRGDDTLISRSDAGEPIPEQDPSVGQVSDDVYADADDVLTGGRGADTFLFRLDINAKTEIAAQHVDANGVIDWQGVAGENGAVHDHWVDAIGNDVILDFSRAQGDQIVIEGHTVLYTLTQEEDHSLLTLYSEQGAAGAHDDDLLGTIAIYGDEVTEADIALDRMVFHGAYDTLDEMLA